MKLTFFSNFLNHHQLYLCKELINILGEENFHFVSCESINNERINMGYEDMNRMYPFVVRAYESEKEMNYAISLAYSSDVAIIGSAHNKFAEIRYRNNKLTFLYRERIFKNGIWHRYIPTTAFSIYKNYTRYREKKFYVLCASAYTENDMKKCFFPKEKCIKWGYFPELLPRAEKKFDKLKILWCGRMLWWKHPENAVKIASILKSRGIDFEMNIIGNGKMRSKIENMIDRLNLHSQIIINDFLSPTNIRKLMNESNVYLFTSGKQEGWGVVLNEAMNSGCVVIANKEAGSVPFLIKDNINGIIYDNHSVSLEQAVDKLLTTDLYKMSNAAYFSISELWNPSVAAERLINMSKELLKGHSISFNEGPCS